MSNQNNSATAEGVNEFIVHTKHTCDSCYQRPIVGKRFTSGLATDYDLCARCYEVYDEEKKGGFSEVLLARDKAAKNSFILKLKIEFGDEEAQTRRIKVSDLWDSSESQLSFDKLISIAQDLAVIDGSDDARFNWNQKLRVTYIDEDGDKINISSNEELMDAFLQTTKKQPFRPFRITVTSAGTNPNDKKQIDASTSVRVTKPIATVRMMNPKVRACRKRFEEPKGGVTEQVVASDAFIHARHTCDVCQKTPIVGTRYHATKIHDFDLCEACHNAYEGEDLAFVPEVLVRDVRMQGRWLKKQLKKLSSKKEVVDLLKKSCEVDPTDMTPRVEQPLQQPHKSTNPMPMKDQQPAPHPSVGVGIHNDIAHPTSEKTVEADEATAQAKECESEPTAPAPAPFFIHARHTCDGCSRTPIIGTRYKATKIPDFDLCETCYKSYDGEDLDFKPETLDIDTRMQPKWIMHQLVKSAQASKSIANLIKSLEESAKAAMNSKAAAACKTESEPTKNDADGKAEAASIRNEMEDKVEVHTDSSEAGIEMESKKPTDDSDAPNSVDEHGEESKTPQSPKSKDESFLSDAEGHGAIAEVIGRTLDVCVQAMEDVLDDEVDQIKNIDQKDIAAIASAAADTYSVGSSIISSVTDLLKKIDDSKGTLVSDMPADVPSTVSGATILKSVEGTNTINGVDAVEVEDDSVESDSWSVIDDKKDKDEFAGAAEMIGSFLYNSGVMSCAEKGEPKEAPTEEGISVEPLSPVVLAKWDEELKQLNELGFTDERKNVDVLERLEASHVCCDSTDKVTVDAVVEALLEEK